MIKSVKVTNLTTGDSMTMELARPEKTGMLIYNITGLGPGTATINAYEVATDDGSMFSSARLSARNIVISIAFHGNDIETLRQKTYKYFPIKKQVELEIVTDNRVSVIKGYVEKNDPTIFSQNEATQISIICTYPYFYKGGEDAVNVTYFYGVEPMFEFPFSNESLTDPLLEFGSIVQEPVKSIWYDGDAEIGIKIFIKATGSAKNITIANLDTQESMVIDTDKIAAITRGSALIEGDEIEISTIQREKYIRLLREGVYYNILNSVGKHANWFKLVKGDNQFAFTAEEGMTNLQFRIENRFIFEGV